MKNMKMKNKLLISFAAVIVPALIIVASGIFGMKMLNDRITVLMTRTLPNTERVWEVRHNLQAEANELLFALVAPDAASRNGFLDKADSQVERNAVLIKEFREHSSVDPTLVDRVDECVAKQSAARKQFHKLVSMGTEESTQEALKLLNTELLPLFSQEAQLLLDVSAAQKSLSQERWDTVNRQYASMNITMVAMLVVALVASAVVVVLLTRAIMTPVLQMEEAARALRKGDFSAEITYKGSDELGTACADLQGSFDELRRIIEVTDKEVEMLAHGDFAFAITEEFPGETQAIQVSLQKLMSRLNDTFTQINMAAAQIDEGSNQVSSSAQALAQGATQQAGTVEELSARLSDVSAKVTSNAENAKEASRLSNEAGEYAGVTLENMKSMSDAMGEISDTSQNIGKVIKVIEDIAFQTNILALNAAVEAARAGAAGKGFAVVADEVRNLAAKSAEAAKNTTTLIESSLATVSRGVEAANQTDESFKILADKVQESVKIIDRITDASVEQASHIQEITSAVDQISSVVQTNSATSEQSAAASEELSSQATLMNELVNQFKLDEQARTPAFGGFGSRSGMQEELLPEMGRSFDAKY